MVIAGRNGGDAKHILVLVNSPDHSGEEEQKSCVLRGRVTGREKILSGIRANGPVIMLAGAVNTGKGLFMEQADHTVAVGNTL